MYRILSGIFALLLAALAGQNPTLAADYPTRPVRIIAPFPPGGTVDIVARILGERLTASLGQPIIVDNRTGAGGIIGSQIVATADPDGHTLLLTFLSHSINPHVYVKLPYDTQRDFAPVARVALSPNVVVVTPSLPVNSIKELIAMAKAQPDKINFASAGIGTNSHLSAEMMNSMAGIKMVHVAYKGGPPANTAVVAGEAQVTIPSMPLTMGHIKAGRLRPIAVTSTKRSPVLPEVPTVAETLPGYESYAWYGIVVPAGTSVAIITRLTGELDKILRMREVTEALAKLGAEAAYMNPKQFGDYITAEMKRWGEVVKAAGLKPGKL
jgi:tripartite-type tricarboxylate transporter receptor subunit TctC